MKRSPFPSLGSTRVPRVLALLPVLLALFGLWTLNFEPWTLNSEAAQQTINIGTSANDGTGDTLRAAFTKVNSNFTEVYNSNAGQLAATNGTAVGLTLTGSTTNSALTASKPVFTDASKVLVSTGTVPLDQGGTAKALTAVNGGLAYSDADSLELTAALTGILRGAGAAAPTAITTSAGIAGELSDETGSGALVFGTGPTISGLTLSGSTTNSAATASRAAYFDSAKVLSSHPTVDDTELGRLDGVTGNLYFAGGTDVAVADGGTGLSSGTSGGILGFTASGTIASSAALAANQLVLGGGAGATPTTLGSLGTTTTVLHGNAAGAPTFGPVSLTADVSGVLPLANGGTAKALTAANGGLAYSDADSFELTAALTGILQGNGAAAPTAITGTANYIPKWSGSAPYLTATSKLFDDGTSVGIGTPTPSAPIHQLSTGGLTNAPNIALILDVESATYTDSGGGTAILLRGKSASGDLANHDQARLRSVAYSGNNNHGFAIDVRPDAGGGLQEAVRISDTRNFMVGTTTGLAKFSLNGGAHIGGDSDPGDNNLLVDGTAVITGNLTASANAIHSGITILTSQTLQTLAAAAAISVTRTKVLVEGSGGAVTLTSTPTIADGTDGQIVYIVGQDSTNTLTVQDESGLAGSNLELGAATRVLGQGDVLVLMFDTDTAAWIEVSFANN